MDKLDDAEDVVSLMSSGGEPIIPMLRVEHVTKTFPKLAHPALDSVSLEVPSGGFTSLIGPSGCGKTTLLRIVAGLTQPTDGNVFIEGSVSEGPSPEKTVVFQHFNLFPWRTTVNNVAYGLELQGVAKKERRERAMHYLELVNLGEFADHYPGELSGGMKQRVGIARALAVEPKVLLMDEPFGALDALTREYLQTELQRICANMSVTVLFVTHSIDEAIYLSDHVVVMGTSPGRIVHELDIELPRPRWEYDVRVTPHFAEIRGQLWTALEKELRVSDSAAKVRTLPGSTE